MGTHKRGAIAVATAALLLAAVASCANDGNDPATSGSPTPSSPAPTTATPTTTPPSETEAASEAASDVVRRYFSVVDQLRKDAGGPPSQLDTVASSSQLTAQKNLLESQRSNGLHQTGETKVVELNVESINLDGAPTALIDVCWDVSGVDVLDEDGKSVVSAERPDSGWTRFTVTNGNWNADPTNGWRVSGGSDLEKEPCVGS